MEDIMKENISVSTGSVKSDHKMTAKKTLLKDLFFTVDTIKSDLTKCGMRLQEALKYFSIPLFTYTQDRFKITYGVASGIIEKDVFCDEVLIKTEKNLFFKKGEKILIYDLDAKRYEINQIKDVNGSKVFLKNGLKNNYKLGSTAIIIRDSELKFFKDQNILKRKSGNGCFKTLVKNVTDFYVSFFPEANSVLYRIEINNKEQVRGYILLTNMVD